MHSWSGVHISVQELLPIINSSAIPGSEMVTCHTRCRCDNAAVVTMINKHISNNPMAMHLLRWRIYICARFTIVFLEAHRGYREWMFSQEITNRDDSSQIPPALIKVILGQTPNWFVQCASSLSLNSEYRNSRIFCTINFWTNEPLPHDR